MPRPLKDPQPDSQPHPEQDTQMQDTPTSPAVVSKKRPRLDLTVDARERKRGKSMFGIVLGTLNKAKIEDKERNASEAVRPVPSYLCMRNHRGKGLTMTIRQRRGS